MNHYLTYKDEKSDKFWSIEVNDNSHTVTYGKTGTKGTAKTKTFDTAEKCMADATKSLKGKLKKGYIENGIEKVGETVKLTKPKVVKKTEKEEIVPIAVDASDQRMEQIERLLLSTEEDNITIALEIIKNDQLAERFKSELFVTYQFSGNKANKEAIKALIQQIKDENLQKAIASRYGFDSASEKKINEYIEKDCVAANLDKDKFAYAIFKKTKDYRYEYRLIRALPYLLKKSAPAFRTKTIQNFIDGTNFAINCDTNLTDLPEEILAFKNIEEISITAPLTKVPKLVTKMTTLKRLKLLKADEKLNALPKEIVNLIALEELDLKEIYLHDFPDQLTKLKSLKKIRFEAHRIGKFPMVVTKINSLESLSIRLPFEKIPNEITNLKNLKHLSLTGRNCGKGFASLLEKMISIEHLEFEIDYSPSLFKAMTKLSNLKKLKLVGSFKEFPIEITEMKQLEEFQIGTVYGDSFNEIPTEIQYLKELKKLTVEGYPLEELPSTLSELPKLTHINITTFDDYNLFKKLPDVLTKIPTLEELVISNTQFSIFEDELATLDTLKRLIITFEVEDEDEDSNQQTIIIKATTLLPFCEISITIVDQDMDAINPSLSKKIVSIDTKNSKEKNLEKLVLKDAITSIPNQIGQLKQLKELRIENSLVLKVSPAIFQLKDTFFFFEKNTPSYIQKIPLLIQDVKQQKITESQAITYLHLLQNEYDSLKNQSLSDLINALDYHLDDIRSKAIDYLDTLLFLEENTIKEKIVVTILGTCTTFSKSEIKKRLKKLGFSIELKLSSKTTHLILGTEPKLQEQQLDVTKIKVTTERNFKDWLDTEDKQLMNNKTEESSNAIANISEMLLSDNDENIQIAIKMMKTHGAGSKELLTALCIFYNHYNTSQGNRTKAKNLFKKNAPKKLLKLLHGDLDITYNSISFYKDLQKNQLMDPAKIAYYFNTAIYFMLIEDREKRIQILQDLVSETTLDLSDFKIDKLPEELLEITGVTELIIGLHIEVLPEWIGNLAIEKLDLERMLGFISIPNSFTNFKALKELKLPHLKVFPEAILKIKTLEKLSMDHETFFKLPNEINKLPQLVSIAIPGFGYYHKKGEKAKAKEKEKTLNGRIKVVTKS